MTDKQIPEAQKQELRKLNSRFERLVVARRLWEPVWQEIADFTAPRKNDILVRRTPGTRRTEKLFDSTALSASEQLAASIHGTLTSSYNKWFSLQTDDQEINENTEVSEWLDECADIMNTRINQSNFASEVHEMYMDLVDFGTGILLEEEKGKSGQLTFKCIQLQYSAIAEDAEGRVDTLFRIFPLSKRAIMEKWPDAVKGLREFDPASMKNADELMDVTHAVVSSDKKRKSRKSWESIYYLPKMLCELERGFFYEFPYFVPRWTKQTGEIYGRGRGHTALPDVKTLNKLTELELRALGKQVNPPLKAVGGDVIGQVKLNMGGVTATRDNNGLAPLLPPINFQPVNLKTEQLKQAIKQIYYSDQLQLNPQSPQMTATEVNVRYELMQRILGPTLGRMESEFLDKLIARTFKILQRANQLPPPPAVITEEKKGLNVRYEGPFARAQKSSDVAAVQQLEQTFEQLMQVHPEILDVLDLDGIVRHTAEVVGIPRKFIRDDDAVQQIRDQKAQQQQAMEQQQQTLTAATAAGKAAPALKAMQSKPDQGSIMGNMQQNAA